MSPNNLSSAGSSHGLKLFYVFFVLGVILVMYKSQDLMFVRYLPESVIYLYGMVVSLAYLFANNHIVRNISNIQFFCICLILFIYAYDVLLVNRLSFLGCIISLCAIVCGSTVLILPDSVKRRILDLFVKITSILVLISLIGWILFLVGVPLPHYTNTSHPYYIHTIYYLFNLNGYPEMQFIPRFAGMFLEPGHLCTMCIFLLYINRFNLHRFLNIVLLAGVLLSFSLAAYGLLIGALIIYLYQIGKKFWLLLSVLVFIAVGIASAMINNGDNPLYQLIYQRLEMNDDGEIAGNNRTSKVFDSVYDKYLDSDRIWLGYGRDSLGSAEDGSTSITIGCATYKRYFFLRGIIGSFLVIILLMAYWYKYRSVRGTGFVIIYLVANMIRDYPMEPIWLYLYILSLPVLKKDHNYGLSSSVSRS